LSISNRRMQPRDWRLGVYQGDDSPWERRPPLAAQEVTTLSNRRSLAQNRHSYQPLDARLSRTGCVRRTGSVSI